MVPPHHHPSGRGHAHNGSAAVPNTTNYSRITDEVEVGEDLNLEKRVVLGGRECGNWGVIRNPPPLGMRIREGNGITFLLDT